MFFYENQLKYVLEDSDVAFNARGISVTCIVHQPYSVGRNGSNTSCKVLVNGDDKSFFMS